MSSEGARAVSVGRGGLQLLQAAAAELGRVGLSVLRELLGAQGLGSWGQQGCLWDPWEPPSPVFSPCGQPSYLELLQSQGLLETLQGMGWRPRWCWGS